MRLHSLDGLKGDALIGGHAEDEMIRCVAIAENVRHLSFTQVYLTDASAGRHTDR